MLSRKLSWKSWLNNEARVWRTPDSQVLEVQKEFSINPHIIIPGTEPALNSLIYGYQQDGKTLDLNGGVAGSYNPNFDVFHLKYHGANASELISRTPEAVKEQYERVISYFVQRGFDMPGSDVPSQYQGMYIGIRSAGQGVTLSSADQARPLLTIQFQYKEEGKSQKPIALDLTLDNSGRALNTALFEPNPANFRNGYRYPIRIPITSDIENFNTSTGPIAFIKHDTIRIRVPETSNGYLVGNRNSNIPPNPAFVYTNSFFILSFQGTFRLMKRDEINNIVSSDFRNSTYLIQTSDLVESKTREIFNGVTRDIVRNVAKLTAPVTVIFPPGETYNGVVLALLNGESPSFDVYNIPPRLAQGVVTNAVGNGSTVTYTYSPLNFSIIRACPKFSDLQPNFAISLNIYDF